MHEVHHLHAFLALALLLAIFGFVVYTTGLQIGSVMGPKLQELESASSP